MMWNGECHENDILTLFDYNATTVDTVFLTYPLMYKPNGEIFLTGAEIGGVTLQNNIVEKAEALILRYNLRSDTEDEDQLGLIWEEEFHHQVQNYMTDKLHIYRLTSSSFSTEVQKSSSITIDLVAAIGVIIGVFSVLATTMFDWVRTKPLLAILGVFTAGLALGSTFGFCAFVSLPYASTAGSMPFLILGKDLIIYLFDSALELFHFHFSSKVCGAKRRT